MPGPPGPEKRRLPPQPSFVVSALVCAGYFLVARAVVNLFPFSTYSMYAGGGHSGGGGAVRGCHLLAVGPSGRAGDVAEFTSWDCPPWEDEARRTIGQAGCPAHYNVEDHIREHIERHAGHDPAAVPVQLVRRVWTFNGAAAATTSDLPVATCRAVRR